MRNGTCRLTGRNKDGIAYAYDVDILQVTETMQAAIERLAAYEDTGLEPYAVKDMQYREIMRVINMAPELEGVPFERLRELAQAEKDGRLVVLPCIAMVEQSLQNGEMKPQRDQRFNGRYAVVYKSNRWNTPLIDICGTHYKTHEAEERLQKINREAAEAALAGEEAEHGES